MKSVRGGTMKYYSILVKSEQPPETIPHAKILYLSEVPKPRNISPSGRKILEALCQRPGKCVSTEVLIDWIWGDDPSGGPIQPARNIHIHICKLRKLFGKKSIRTHHGHGWSILPSVAYAIKEIYHFETPQVRS